MIKFAIVIVLLWMVISLFVPPKQNVSQESQPKKKEKRFDSTGYDISDGEYEEIR